MRSNCSDAVHSGLHIIKGALFAGLAMPYGGRFNYVLCRPGGFTVNVGPVSKSPSDEDKRLVQRLIDEKIYENVPFKIEYAEFSIVQNLPPEVFFSSNIYCEAHNLVRIVILPGWNFLITDDVRVLSSTGLLKRLEVSSFDFHESNQTLSLNVNLSESSGTEYAADVSGNVIKDAKELPRLNEFYRVCSNEDLSGQKITPWGVTTTDNAIDYDKLLHQFGCSMITSSQIERLEKITGRKAHHFLRRGIFFSHKSFDFILDTAEKGKPFYLYTGRGPSSQSLHIGHLIPFLFTKYLQEVFDVFLVIQLTDDEKCLFKEKLTPAEAHRLAYENAKDIIALGFPADKTFIFSDMDYIDKLYPVVLDIQKKIPFNQTKGIFGFNDSDNIGKVAFPAIQAAPSFSCSFPGIFGTAIKIPCLIPQAIDQDPFFRMTRDIAPRLGLLKPAVIHSRFIPGLEGFQTKMSGSVESSSVYITDDRKTVQNKIFKQAFSGGQVSIAEHRAKGANLDVDVSFQYLNYFVEDDEELDKIANAYKSGIMLTGEIKKILVEKLLLMFDEHKKKRALVTDEVVQQFMNPSRPLFKERLLGHT